jgi:hypothetical protein
MAGDGLKEEGDERCGNARWEEVVETMPGELDAQLA